MSARVTTLADRQAALWALRQRARETRLWLVQGERSGNSEKETETSRPLTEPPISGIRHRRPVAKAQ